jgi:hypothetical protein
MFKPSFLKFIAFTGLAFSIACIKDPKIANYTPTIAAPLVNSTLSMQDLLARTDTSDLIIVDPVTQLLALNYTNDDLDFGLSDIYDPTNISFSTSIPFGSDVASTTPGGELTISGNLVVPVGLPIELYEANFSTLDIIVSASSTFNHEIEIDFSLNKLTKNQTAYTASINTPILGNDTDQQDFSNSELSFEDNGQPNKAALSYTLKVKTNGAPISQNDAITLDFNFNNIQLENVVFNPGNVSVTIPEDSVILKVFRHASNFNIDFGFSDPQVLIDIYNGTELPYQFTINELSVLDVVSDQQTDLLLNNFPNPFDVAGGTSNQPSTTNLLINKNNSNIVDVISPNEKLIRFGLGASTQAVANQRYTLSATDRIAIDLQAKIPLKGFVSDYVLSSDVEVDLSDLEETVIDGGIRYHIVNNFPAGVHIMVYYEDENGNDIGQLTDQPIVLLEAPAVDGIGKITQPTITSGDITLTEAEFELLFSANKLRLEATLGTTGSDTRSEVGIFLDNFIDVKLGVKARINAN